MHPRFRPLLSGTYSYDAIGNLTSKEGKTFGYDPVRPHVLATVNGSAVGIVHDDNGTRLGNSNTTTYEHDPEGRLAALGGIPRG